MQLNMLTIEAIYFIVQTGQTLTGEKMMLCRCSHIITDFTIVCDTHICQESLWCVLPCSCILFVNCFLVLCHFIIFRKQVGDVKTCDPHIREVSV